MTIEERAAKAADLKTAGACNCSQAVVKVFEDKLSLDGETLMKLTAGYAAGMGCLEATCGALSKFFIVLAMSAVGLNTNIIKLIKTGGKPLALGFCCWIGITIASLSMQHVLGIW